MSTPTPPPTALFHPLPLGPFTLSHRLVLGPLTRYRASTTHVPLPFVTEYYAQRACVPGTLLISEGTFISARAGGMACVPGIWNAAQVAAWRDVTAAVHARGCVIYCQLWALGRAASAEVLGGEGAGDVVSASARGLEGGDVPRALREEEIAGYVADYAQAARNAVEAGFDGVEVHGANGYLVDQFVQDVVNVRADAWGGDVEGRARFALAVAAACADAIGPERVGMRLSPWSTFQEMGMARPGEQFARVVRGLRDLGLAYLHLVESRIRGNTEATVGDAWAEGDNAELVSIWAEGGHGRPVLLAGGFKPETARACVDERYAGANVAVVFGRMWISNPDLAFRIREGIPLSRYDRDTFYKAQSRDGYTDYPFCEEFEAAQPKI